MFCHCHVSLRGVCKFDVQEINGECDFNWVLVSKRSMPPQYWIVLGEDSGPVKSHHFWNVPARNCFGVVNIQILSLNLSARHSGQKKYGCPNDPNALPMVIWGSQKSSMLHHFILVISVFRCAAWLPWWQGVIVKVFPSAPAMQSCRCSCDSQRRLWQYKCHTSRPNLCENAGVVKVKMICDHVYIGPMF